MGDYQYIMHIRGGCTEVTLAMKTSHCWYSDNIDTKNAIELEAGEI